MDALLFNLVGDVPAVTKTWVAGIVIMSVLMSTTIVDAGEALYNFDLVFKRGQYMRIVYSFFNYGNLSVMFFVGVAFMIMRLAAVEKAAQTRGHFLWMIFVMSSIVIGVSKWVQPYGSLAHVLHRTLIYYKIRKDIQLDDHLGGGFASPLMIYMCSDILELKNIYSVWGMMLTYLPGQLFYFLEEVVSKVYGVNLCKPPNLWFKKSLHETDVETDEGVEQLQE
ncbi:LANO_0E09032g1_1 [Lachancea nothofagi CBS 11611]|uniref:Derlin n=1 Tax=Lachancea nothofagi CBS 11611 TaxID=1266666 RepID=A0A1G4JVG1_9SACH|nr:LANO_0E09032g1_1 [Lachancea nothofagi CBS 11611]